MWDWAVWGALGVAICSGIAGLALVVVRTVEAVRTLGAVRRSVMRAIGTTTAKAELAAAKAEAAGDTQELQESVARLRVSLARIAILRAALERADEQLGWVRVLL